jgi:hypothetical protein
MDNETTFSVQNLVKYSYEQKPVEFEQTFNSLLSDKIASAIDARKLEVAQSMFNDYSEEEINTEQESDTEESTDGETA